MMTDDDDIRSAVHSMYAQAQHQQQQQYQQFQSQQFAGFPGISAPSSLHSFGPGPSGLPRSQSHMVNLLSEDFIAGYMDEGRMSVVRRFFCLFVTFDVVFISLLWIICVMITGDNIRHALETQVLHYTIEKSLFDVVVIALMRFIFLILFYGLCHLNHWIVIAWTETPQPVFEVLLVVVSFVLAWGEAWFLDCRVIPQERYARNYYVALTNPAAEVRSPLLAPFLNSALSTGRTESVGNFYSPYDSIHNSEDEEDEQDDEFKRMGIECVRKAYVLLESTDWKLEKVTSKGDTIQSCTKDKVGKIYKLTKIDSHTDISYQATIGGGGGVVKCRDFVNLRCWQLCREGRVIEGVDLHPTDLQAPALTPVTEEVPDDDDGDSDDDECILAAKASPQITKSLSEFKLGGSSVSSNEQNTKTAFSTLSKSLGAQDFGAGGANSDPEDVFSDALTEHQAGGKQPAQVEQEKKQKSEAKVRVHKPRAEECEVQKGGNVYVSAAISIEYPGAPVTTKYIRGENKVSCWAMREIENQKDYCIFEWLLCLDLKGYIPRYVLDTFMV
ncbi:Start1 [Culex quinquefasciatus]|uniref:Start1 n=1 Tax=Culex quinquefasciatus TaxID=7176 RepID=B0WCN9_CULQU|nr:Start1 [Culex quinquefasciatus]|eukprot:XP_001846473.1 Start1 [Culex quinquefasciatus]